MKIQNVCIAALVAACMFATAFAACNVQVTIMADTSGSLKHVNDGLYEQKLAELQASDKYKASKAYRDSSRLALYDSFYKGDVTDSHKKAYQLLRGARTIFGISASAGGRLSVYNFDSEVQTSAVVKPYTRTNREDAVAKTKELSAELEGRIGGRTNLVAAFNQLGESVANSPKDGNAEKVVFILTDGLPEGPGGEKQTAAEIGATTGFKQLVTSKATVNYVLFGTSEKVRGEDDFKAIVKLMKDSGFHVMTPDELTSEGVSEMLEKVNCKNEASVFFGNAHKKAFEFKEDYTNFYRLFKTYFSEKCTSAETLYIAGYASKRGGETEAGAKANVDLSFERALNVACGVSDIMRHKKCSGYNVVIGAFGQTYSKMTSTVEQELADRKVVVYDSKADVSHVDKLGGKSTDGKGAAQGPPLKLTAAELHKRCSEGKLEYKGEGFPTFAF